MVSQARANALQDRLDQSLIGSVHAALGHDVHRQLLRRAGALGVPERELPPVGGEADRHGNARDRTEHRQ